MTESMLGNNPADAAVARGVGSIESHGQSPPRKYFLHHPVIQVNRETELVRDWVRIPKNSNRMQCLEGKDRNTNYVQKFEYYNVFDWGSQKAYTSRRGEHLKEKFLDRFPQNAEDPTEDTAGFHSFYIVDDGISGIFCCKCSKPRYYLPVFKSVYTYALSVEFTHFTAGEVDAMELE